MKNWLVTVPLWRTGKPVPVAERIEQLERYRGLTGDTHMRFETETEAHESAFLWTQALGFSVEAKYQPPIPTEKEQ